MSADQHVDSRADPKLGIRPLKSAPGGFTVPFDDALLAYQLKRTLVERVQAGMDRARAEGKHVGRPSRMKPITEHRLWPVVRASHLARHPSRSLTSLLRDYRRINLLLVRWDTPPE